RAYS
ncbi:IMV membrane protein A21, partial [Monkeypox virus]